METLMKCKKVVFVEDEDDKGNIDGMRGHLKTMGKSEYNPGIYERFFKRIVDITLSTIGLIALSPLCLIVIIAIEIDDLGPVLFTHKRIGKNKKYFRPHKFRSMKMATPHDVPTHMLDNPDQYISKVPLHAKGQYRRIASDF